MTEIHNYYDNNYVYRSDRHINSALFDSPKTLYEYFDSKLYGHEKYKKAVALLIYKAVHFSDHHPGALLVDGPSGTGKTELLRILSSIYGRNITIVDASSITPAGYKGTNHLTSLLATLDFNSEFPPIVVLDEFDKLLDKANSSWSNTGLLAELYKFIEGGRFNIGSENAPRYIDIDRMIVILLGSFSSLTDINQSNGIGYNAALRSDDIKRSPLKKEQILEQLTPELQGRISQIVILDDFTEDDFLKILKDDRYSPVSRLAQQFNVDFSISSKKYREIAHEAYVSKTGVRSMNNKISGLLDEMLFEKGPDIHEVMIQ